MNMPEEVREGLVSEPEARAMLGVIIGTIGEAKILSWSVLAWVEYPDGTIEERCVCGDSGE